MKTQKEINAMIDRGEYKDVIEIAIEQGYLGKLKVFAAKCALINIESIEKYYDEHKYEYKRILHTVTEISKNNYIGSRDCNRDDSIVTNAVLYDVHKIVADENTAASIYYVVSAALDYCSAQNSVESFYESAIDASVNAHIASVISSSFRGLSKETFYIPGFITEDDDDDINVDIGDSIHLAYKSAAKDRNKSTLERNSNRDAALKKISKSCDALSIASMHSILSAVNENSSCEPQVKKYLKEVFE